MRIASLALTVVLLAGCIGGSPETADPQALTSPPTDLPLETEELPEAPVVYNPHHTHDYWGEAEFVYLLKDFEIPLGQDVQEETMMEGEDVIVGHRAFDMLDDGTDENKADKADVVYQGTKAIAVTVSWTADPTKGESIPGLTFLYKHASSPLLVPIDGIPNGEEFQIQLQKGWVDMAHQLRLSRWEFALQAFDPAASGTLQTHVARGTVTVTIRAINGGHASIDDPHPYNFLETDRLPAGDIEETVDFRVVRTPEQDVESGSPAMGWQAPAPSIVPWETHTVRAWLHYNYTGPVSPVPHAAGLRYTDASGIEEKRPEATDSGAGWAYYEIPVQSNEADDPYAQQSDWTWGVYPILNGSPEQGGDFQGNVHIRLEAVGDSEVMS